MSPLDPMWCIRFLYYTVTHMLVRAQVLLVYIECFTGLCPRLYVDSRATPSPLCLLNVYWLYPSPILCFLYDNMIAYTLLPDALTAV